MHLFILTDAYAFIFLKNINPAILESERVMELIDKFIRMEDDQVIELLHHMHVVIH